LIPQYEFTGRNPETTCTSSARWANIQQGPRIRANVMTSNTLSHFYQEPAPREFKAHKTWDFGFYEVKVYSDSRSR
jgi:hypothetical protein